MPLHDKIWASYMKYENSKDLAEAQRYLKLLDNFCKTGQVCPPEPDVSAMPWDKREDPLEEYLLCLLGEEKYGNQVANSKLRGKVFYDTVGKFVVECVHHLRFQRQRAWTESHRADALMDESLPVRMARSFWVPLLKELDERHRDDGFDHSFFLHMMEDAGAIQEDRWLRLVHDWKECLWRQVTRKLKEFIGMRRTLFEQGLRRTMEQVTRHVAQNHLSEQRAVQAWELMSGGWTETEFERRLNQMKIQDRYPEIREIVARMGRMADAAGKDRLAVASGVPMKMEHSSGSDIEGITMGDNLNALLPFELAQYGDEDMDGLFFYKYRMRRLQTFRYKSEMAKPSRRLGATHASRKGPMIVCIDTSASMYGTPERISSTLVSLLEETADELGRDCFLIDFSVSIRTIDLMEKRRLKRLQKLGIQLATDLPEEKAGIGSLPFIGGGTSAKKLMAMMFDLLDNDGLRYVNADVLWITDFLIPAPSQNMLARLKEYRDTGTRFYGIRIVHEDDGKPNLWDAYFNKIYTIRYRPVKRY